MSGLDSVGVGITTKDRWEDLEVTLIRLQESGLDCLETVVIDDGSAIPTPAKLREQFPRIRFIRFESSQGLIARRNRIANLLSTPFILGLDDDSFPVEGSLEAAANWMLERPKVVALAFQIIFRNESPPVHFATKAPFLVRDYIGCGNLVRRELFLSLGSYEERFEFFTEEAEFCLRAIQQGYEIYAYPGFVIRHNLSPVARNHPRRTEKFIRNEMLMALWHFPIPESFLRAGRAFPAMLIKNPALRKNWRSLLKGYLEAPIQYLRWPHNKQRLTFQQFKAWKKLPMAAQVVMGIKQEIP
jgi:GT2 family glycosyltransferase